MEPHLLCFCNTIERHFYRSKENNIEYRNETRETTSTKSTTILPQWWFSFDYSSLRTSRDLLMHFI